MLDIISMMLLPYLGLDIGQESLSPHRILYDRLPQFYFTFITRKPNLSHHFFDETIIPWTAIMLNAFNLDVGCLIVLDFGIGMSRISGIPLNSRILASLASRILLSFSVTILVYQTAGTFVSLYFTPLESPVLDSLVSLYLNLGSLIFLSLREIDT